MLISTKRDLLSIQNFSEKHSEPDKSDSAESDLSGSLCFSLKFWIDNRSLLVEMSMEMATRKVSAGLESNPRNRYTAAFPGREVRRGARSAAGARSRREPTRPHGFRNRTSHP